MEQLFFLPSKYVLPIILNFFGVEAYTFDYQTYQIMSAFLSFFLWCVFINIFVRLIKATFKYGGSASANSGSNSSSTALTAFSIFAGIITVILFASPLWKLTSPYLIDFVLWMEDSTYDAAKTKVWFIAVFLTCGFFAGVVAAVHTLGNIVVTKVLMAGIFGSGDKQR